MKNKNKEIRYCEFCKEGEVKSYKGRFCSRSCQGMWQKSISWEEKVGVVVADQIREKRKENVGIKNPMYGKSRPDLSARNKAGKGKVYTNEMKEKFSIAQKKSWANGGRKITKAFISKPEQEITEYIRSLNIEVIQQFHIKGFHWNYDLYLPSYNLVIEYNGSLWHCNPKKFKEDEVAYFPGKIVNVKDVWAKDKLKNDMLIERGYRLEIIWDDDYKERGFDLINEIIKKYEYEKR